MKRLILVESPTKARTLSGFLRSHWKNGAAEILATMGHIRDLPARSLGVDIQKDFAPTYEVIPSKAAVLRRITEAAKKAVEVYVATDYDREGEAIGWHVVQAASIPRQKVKRIVFHEITPAAIRQALAKPRAIDERLVEAQQARRILDRLVGYQISPLLGENLRSGLSAGRVQSVALRLVVDREREVQEFRPQEYWTLEVRLRTAKGEEFTGQVVSRDTTALEKSVADAAAADQIRRELEGARISVSSFERGERVRRPPPPFMTSTLQQEAFRRLGFYARETMRLAQDLYERGWITYMRTDSLNVASSAIAAARRCISERFGQEYLPDAPRRYKSRVLRAQEAHEAIRPTKPQQDSAALREAGLTQEHRRLYDLIHRRFLASQMADAVYETTSAKAEAWAKSKWEIRASGQRLVFRGFLAADPFPEKEEEAPPLPAMSPGDPLTLVGCDPKQHFTQPPPRFSEATLIAELEKNGIGRPSTYAPTVSLLRQRGYVRTERGRFHPQPIAFTVVDALRKHFPDIMDLKFTSRVEEDLDRIAEGKRPWISVLREFHQPFSRQLEKARTAMKNLERPVDARCPLCDSAMEVRTSRFGRFYSCSRYPACRGKLPLNAEFSEKRCPNCGRKMLVWRSRRRPPMLQCTGHPVCKTRLPASAPSPQEGA